LLAEKWTIYIEVSMNLFNCLSVFSVKYIHRTCGITYNRLWHKLPCCRL